MKIGSKLRIPINLTVDPLNKRGETGTLIANKLGIYTIRFSDGKEGKYFASIWAKFEKGGKVKESKMHKNIIKPDYSNNNDVSKENAEMILNQNTQIKHHTSELKSAVKAGAKVPAWVVAKINRSANDISDATHYLEGSVETKMQKGGKVNSMPTHKINCNVYYIDSYEEFQQEAVPEYELQGYDMQEILENDDNFLYIEKGEKGFYDVETNTFETENGSSTRLDDECVIEIKSTKNKRVDGASKTQNTSATKTSLTIGTTINVDDYIFINKMGIYNKLQDRSIETLTLSKMKKDTYVFTDKNNKIYNVWIYGIYPRPKFKKGDIIDLTKYQNIESGQSLYCKSYNITKLKIINETRYDYIVDLNEINPGKTITISKETIIPIDSMPKFDYKIGDFISIDALTGNVDEKKLILNDAKKIGFNKLEVVGYYLYDETKQFLYEVIGYDSTIPYKTYHLYVNRVEPKKMQKGGKVALKMNELNYSTKGWSHKQSPKMQKGGNINMIKKRLDGLGVEYEMSKTNKVQPFKVIYKPIDESDEFYNKFENIVDLFNLKGVVKLTLRKRKVNKMQHGGMVNIDYNKLISLIKAADNPKNLPIYYNSSQNVINIGGVGYDKGDLVKMFNSQPGQSSDIKNLFYKANQHPNETKKAIESMNKGIKIRIGYGYGNEPFVEYMK